jgi:predicted DNA-binding protein (MmcQ/YjbR family)
VPIVRDLGKDHTNDGFDACDDGAMGTHHPLDDLETFALGLPGAFRDMPWEGDVVAKVGTKIFVFFGSGGEAPAISVKLPASADHALSIPGARPTSYGLGRHGWVTVPVSDTPPDLLQDWVEESYRAIATKKLVAELDGRG